MADPDAGLARAEHRDAAAGLQSVAPAVDDQPVALQTHEALDREGGIAGGEPRLGDIDGDPPELGPPVREQ